MSIYELKLHSIFLIVSLIYITEGGSYKTIVALLLVTYFYDAQQSDIFNIGVVILV